MKALFEPEIRLLQDSEGHYVLQATTPTPNSCHVAGETKVSPPPPPFQPGDQEDGASPLPGPRPMMVKLKIEEVDSDICLPYVKPVHHCVTLYPPSHVTEIQAIVMLNGEKLEEELLPLDSSDSSSEEPDSILGTEDFQAWLNLMPPGQPTLHVQGSVIFPDARYQASLQKSEQTEQGDTFVLNLDVERRTGIFPPVVTTRSVEFEQSGTDLERFKRVKVLLPGEKTINLTLHKVFSDNVSRCRMKGEDEEEFRAFLDLMPPGEPTLRVRGSVQVASSGYQVSLQPKSKTSQDKTDKTLALELMLEPPENVAQPVISLCPVEYDQSGSETKELEHVLILRPGGERPIQVPIKEVN